MYLSALLALLAPVALGQATNCTQYCDTISTVCTGANAQFSTGGSDDATAKMFCNIICPIYPMTGAVNDTAGDSFNCRAYHLMVAQGATDPAQVAAHCMHAGFYGGGVCGNTHNGAVTPASSATDFQCDLVKAKCNNNTDLAQCYTDYTKYAPFVMDSFNMSNTKVLFKDTGNTLQCRTMNVLEILMGTPMASACMDGGAVSSACVVNCTDFCLIEGSACGFGTTGNNQYASSAACMSACATWTMAPVNMSQPIAMGDSSGCRWYHLSVAATSTDNAATHCPHTKDWPSAYCMSSCDYYCSTIQAACTGANMQFATSDDCMTACNNYTKLTQPYTRPVVKGDSLECRTYHAEVAYASWSNAMTHCPHASKMSSPGWCVKDSGAASVKVGVATAVLMLVGVASSFLGL